MPKLLLLIAIATAIWYWWSLFKRRTGDQRRPFLWRSAFWGILGLSVFLVATGRMHWLGAGLAALIPIGKGLLALSMRALPFINILSRFKTTPSQFRTRSLVVEINFANRQMNGEILQGDFAGQRLSQLSPEALQQFSAWLKETDRESYVLLQAYLLRSGSSQYSSNDKQPADYSDFSTEEAYKILGLENGASTEDVIKAHKRLMQRLHPDRGGSDYLAAKINSAKDKLLS
ncbi:MAG: DnaJ domain-containing protein [Porticoccaceae bacterium]